MEKVKLLIDSFTNFSEHNYHREFGAMLAEFQFLDSVSLEIRKKAREETLKLLLLLLDVEATDPLQYIEKQHHSGRYDKASLKKIQQNVEEKHSSFKMQLFVLGASYGDIPGVLAVSKAMTEIKSACEKLADGHNSPAHHLQESSALIQICTKLQRLPKLGPS